MARVFGRRPKPAEARPVQWQGVPDDLWSKCPRCGHTSYRRDLDKSAQVCPHCAYHYRLPARERLALLLDEGSFEEEDAGLRAEDALEFVDTRPYVERLAVAEDETGLADAIVAGSGRINGIQVQVGAMDFGFMGGSMGAVVGEKITRAAERALQRREPLILICASGGARMQEGIFSLMQLAKTSTALQRLGEARVPYFAVLTDPTMGGATASFASLGDVLIAEPGASIGFAGRRVIEQTLHVKLPQDFQTAEFEARHGLVDLVISRSELRDLLVRLLGLYQVAA